MSRDPGRAERRTALAGARSAVLSVHESLGGDADGAVSLGALRVTVRLMELATLRPAAAIRSWADFGAASRDLESFLVRPDEITLSLRAASPDDDAFRRACGRVLEAAADLARSHPDDPIGTMYESVLQLVRSRRRGSRPTRRSQAGAFYTPDALVEHVIRSALDPLGGSPRVCDPAAGSGRFLVSAARHLRTGSRPIADVIASSVFGVDIDPIAVEIMRFRLWQEAGFARDVLPMLLTNCRVGDSLVGPPPAFEGDQAAADAWCAPAAGPCLHWPIAFNAAFDDDDPGFDAVVGNPPFLGQLSAGTAFHRAAAEVIRRWSDGLLRGYADAAAAFLLRSLQLVRRGGRVALVQPQSLLASRDAAGVREWIGSNADLESIWIATGRVFDETDVLVCVPTVARRTPTSRRVRLTSGLPPEAGDPSGGVALAGPGTWSELAAEVRGIPQVAKPAGRPISSIASATADFRDQYYGLRGMLIDRTDADDAAFPPLVTVGLLDPARCRWGESPARVHKQAWVAPRINRELLERETDLGAWLDARLVPKILVATQTRVIEAFVDEAGTLAPSTPMLSITPADASDLWRIAAAVNSPVCSAIALRRFTGAALTGDTIKLAARQILDLPLPTDDAAWDRAAEAFRLAQHAESDAERRKRLCESATESLEAYRVPTDHRSTLLGWWLDRLPSRPADRLG